MYWFGGINPFAWRKAVVKTRAELKTNADGWIRNADAIASIDPRMAARCRDLAHAQMDLSFYCGELVRTGVVDE